MVINVKTIKYIIWLLYPVFFIALFASLLTTKTYMNISEDRYPSHQDITYDYTYVSGKLIDYLNYRHDDLYFGANASDVEPILRHEVNVINGEEVVVSEIEHMEDVREVYTQIRLAGIISLIIVVGLSILLYKKHPQLLYETYRDIYYFPAFFILFVGGWMIIAFDITFTVFHEIFFDGNWQFRTDDTLILMLPSMFWLVSGIIILLLLSVTIGFTTFLSKKYLKRHLFGAKEA